MQAFQWDEHFVTGLQDVDDQHRHLLDLINRMGKALADDQVTLKGVESILDELVAYTAEHFAEEERLMALHNIDPRHRDEHVGIHRKFVGELVSMRISLCDNSARYLLDFLTHWLAYHILGKDQQLAVQILAIRAGMLPGQAFEQSASSCSGAIEPLLKAMNGLFEQVAARNHELLELNQSLEAQVRQRTEELLRANRHLEDLALSDSLTGLPNRRHAMRRLAALWEESSLNGIPLSCMLIDADKFKAVNDTHGHDAGDAVLIALASAMRHAVRTDDIVCRLGGDEFLVICPNTDRSGGLRLAGQLHRTVSAMRVATGSDHWRGSISVGLAVRDRHMAGFEALIKAADRSVYAAKRAGRNCIKAIS